LLDAKKIEPAADPNEGYFDHPGSYDAPDKPERPSVPKPFMNAKPDSLEDLKRIIEYKLADDDVVTEQEIISNGKSIYLKDYKSETKIKKYTHRRDKTSYYLMYENRGHKANLHVTLILRNMKIEDEEDTDLEFHLDYNERKIVRLTIIDPTKRSGLNSTYRVEVDNEPEKHEEEKESKREWKSPAGFNNIFKNLNMMTGEALKNTMSSGA